LIAIEDVETLARIHRLYKGSGGDQATGNGKRYIHNHSLMAKEWRVTANLRGSRCRSCAGAVSREE
jgi:hypothetical protein